LGIFGRGRITTNKAAEPVAAEKQDMGLTFTQREHLDKAFEIRLPWLASLEPFKNNGGRLAQVGGVSFLWLDDVRGLWLIFGPPENDPSHGGPRSGGKVKTRGDLRALWKKHSGSELPEPEHADRYEGYSAFGAADTDKIIGNRIVAYASKHGVDYETAKRAVLADKDRR
jgi:hypothetical protein